MATAFPTIMNRVEVVDVQSTEVSPLAHVCRVMAEKLNSITSTHAQITQSAASAGAKRSRANANLLTMTLNDVLDDTSSFSVPAYRNAFFTAQYVATHPSQLNEIEELRRLIDEAARAIASCLKLHASLHSPDMAAFHVTLLERKPRILSWISHSLVDQLVCTVFESIFTDEIKRLGLVEHHSLRQSVTTAENGSVGDLARSPVIQVSADGPRAIINSSNGHAEESFNATEEPLSGHLRSPGLNQAGPSTLSHLKPVVSNGVRFTDQIDASARPTSISASHQHTPSITSTTNSGRPGSFLGRFSSLRRKNKP